ncbi:hypothetical protein V1512DRAFT_245832 [Lipomyces arxii]|uniref:uncharacterized protein n=1 Tax=Lipomyces arxii TaxID=56418 RepID=UPI0034CE3543
MSPIPFNTSKTTSAGNTHIHLPLTIDYGVLEVLVPSYIMRYRSVSQLADLSTTVESCDTDANLTRIEDFGQDHQSCEENQSLNDWLHFKIDHFQRKCRVTAAVSENIQQLSSRPVAVKTSLWQHVLNVRPMPTVSAELMPTFTAPTNKITTETKTKIKTDLLRRQSDKKSNEHVHFAPVPPSLLHIAEIAEPIQIAFLVRVRKPAPPFISKQPKSAVDQNATDFVIVSHFFAATLIAVVGAILRFAVSIIVHVSAASNAVASSLQHLVATCEWYEKTVYKWYEEKLNSQSCTKSGFQRQSSLVSTKTPRHHYATATHGTSRVNSNQKSNISGRCWYPLYRFKESCRAMVNYLIAQSIGRATNLGAIFKQILASIKAYTTIPKPVIDTLIDSFKEDFVSHTAHMSASFRQVWTLAIIAAIKTICKSLGSTCKDAFYAAFGTAEARFGCA